LDEGLRLGEMTDFWSLKTYSLITLIETYHEVRRHADAEAAVQRLLSLAQSAGDGRMEAEGWAAHGLAFSDQNRWAESADAYNRALGLWLEQGDRINALRAQAGLAQAALALDNRAEARAHVDEILPSLPESKTIYSMTFAPVIAPYTIHLTCYRVLAALEDPRAAGVLEKAYHLVQERAARIPDPEQRRSFTENLIEVRAILAEHAQLAQRTASADEAVDGGGEASAPIASQELSS
jgi:tetratricopeptide (TPR) repeat protein